ncbi:MAG: hypothetical protein IPN86_07345 [Saprospiraceae bacterium]|nr:hypothetical protein [Saprospiraceae bacterium]
MNNQQLMLVKCMPLNLKINLNILKHQRNIIKCMILTMIVMGITACTKESTEESEPTCNLATNLIITKQGFESNKINLLLVNVTLNRIYKVVLKKGGKLIKTENFKNEIFESKFLVFSDLLPETDYTIIISSFCDDGTESKQSVAQSFKTEKSCILPDITNISIDFDTLTFFGNLKWDAVQGASGYYVIMKDFDTKEVLNSPSISLGTNYTFSAFPGTKAYFEISSACNIDGKNVPNTKTANSSILQTTSYLSQEKVSKSTHPCFKTECSIRDAQSPILIEKNTGGNYYVDFSNEPDNTCFTYYIRFSWLNTFADLPLFIEKKNGNIKVFYQTNDCIEYKSELKKGYADFLIQEVVIDGKLRNFTIRLGKNRIYLSNSPDIECKGKLTN